MRQTSLDSYFALLWDGTLGERQSLVLYYIVNHPGSTDREIAEELGFKDPNSIRPRRKELLDKGLIENCGIKKCSVTGRAALAWRSKR